MARSTRVVPKSSPRSSKTSSGVNQSQPPVSPSPRRSSRLHSSPSRPAASRTTATSAPRAAAPTDREAESRCGDSRHPTNEPPFSLKQQAEPQEQQQQQPVPPVLSGKAPLARGSATHLPPNADSPRSPNKLKRRRGLDHYDLVPIPSSAPQDLDNELTTPRALRALKRQRLHLHIEAPATPEPSPSGVRHDSPRSPSPSSGDITSQPEPGCPEPPPKEADNDLRIVETDATAPADSLGKEEHHASYGDNEAERQQFGSGLSLSATKSLSPAVAVDASVATSSHEDDALAEPSDANVPSTGAARDLDTASGDTQSVSADRSASPAPASNDAVPQPSAAPASAQNEDAQEAPEPASEPAPMEAQPQSPLHGAPPPANLAAYMPTPEEQWAHIAANYGLTEESNMTLPSHRWRVAAQRAGVRASRGVRPKNQKFEAWVGTWRYETMVRVEAMLEWASYELVRVYNDLQTRDDPVDFYNFSAENLPDDVVGMMDVDEEEEEASDASAEAASDEDDSDDDEDDEDFDVPDASNVIMEVDSIEPAPEFVQGSSTTATALDVPEEPNRTPESPPANLTMPPSSIPPRFRSLTPRLPGLFSFHSGTSDQPQLTPDGLPFVGRGTPVDKRRRDDWANIRPASPRYPSRPHYTTSDEDWFSLVTTPSILSGNTSSLSSDTNFGVPTEVGPFCCTQDGLYGSEGSLIPPKYDPHESAAGMSTDGNAGAFDYPAPPQAWMQPPVRESTTPFPEFPPQLTGDFPGNAPEAAAFPPAPQTQATSTGCILHHSLLECLTSGLGCVSGPFAGVQMQMPTPPPTPPMVPCNVEAANPPGVLGGMDVGPYDVAMESVPVQASSALSHALG